MNTDKVPGFDVRNPRPRMVHILATPSGEGQTMEVLAIHCEGGSRGVDLLDRMIREKEEKGYVLELQSEDVSETPVRETVYDEKIAPLMTQIIAICKEADISFISCFQLDDREEDERRLHCLTYVAPQQDVSSSIKNMRSAYTGR